MSRWIYTVDAGRLMGRTRSSVRRFAQKHGVEYRPGRGRLGGRWDREALLSKWIELRGELKDVEKTR